eukprot:TRINITY_DN40809_c0_g1_i1.p1 TRINITY_DN40809_c0_g1~~TRINITY_DN40809_c0_g1_i1.p1  ORF type:complete len:377 (-),score=36.40 TRINITY_DN40809_c0_g1_i1:661-1791(-)
MVHLKLEAVDTGDIPKDMYVGVRIGDMQKLSRVSSLASAKSFKFPASAVGDRRSGKLEIYKRIGGWGVGIDSSRDEHLYEVSVPTNDAAMSSINFLVEVMADSSGKDVPDGTLHSNHAASKVQGARDYLQAHQLEMRLSEAMQAVLRERPSDPAAFIANMLLGPRGSVKEVARPQAVSGDVRPSRPQTAPATRTAPLREEAIRQDCSSPDADRATVERPSLEPEASGSASSAQATRRRATMVETPSPKWHSFGSVSSARTARRMTAPIISFEAEGACCSCTAIPSRPREYSSLPLQLPWIIDYNLFAKDPVASPKFEQKLQRDTLIAASSSSVDATRQRAPIWTYSSIPPCLPVIIDYSLFADKPSVEKHSLEASA